MTETPENLTEVHDDHAPRLALVRLLNCTELNLDSLEPETSNAIDYAHSVLTEMQNGGRADAIVACFVRPPIPSRNYDWCARYAAEGENPHRCGWGATRDAAIADLESGRGRGRA